MGNARESPAVEPKPGILQIDLPTAAATRRLGAVLGRLCQPGDVLALEGPLGVGKTCLVQGLSRGLKIADKVTSPTFTLINEYGGQSGGQSGDNSGPRPQKKADRPRPLFHVDLYRLGSEEELFELGLWEAAESGGVMAVEWLSRFPTALPLDRLELRLEPGPGRGRTLRIKAGGARSWARLLALASALHQPFSL